MNRVDQLELRVRALTKCNAALTARVAAQDAALAELREHVGKLEIALAARRVRRKRPAPDHVDILGRERLWATYVSLEMEFGNGRVRKLTKLDFGIRHKINPDEVCRWLSYVAKRGIPEGSVPDTSIRRALAAEILQLGEVQRAEAERRRPSSLEVSLGSTLSPNCSGIFPPKLPFMDESLNEFRETERECIRRFRAKAAEIAQQHPELSAQICFARAVGKLPTTCGKYQYARQRLQLCGIAALPLR